MTKISSHVEISGPLFDKGPLAVKEAIKRTIGDLVEEGEQHAKSEAGTFRKTGRYQGSLRGKVAKTGKSGRVKAYGGPKKLPYSAVHERGRYWPSTGTRFTGHKVLARTQKHLDQRAQSILNKRGAQLVQELS